MFSLRRYSMELADKWHQERLLITRKLTEVWTDYGTFLARCGKFGKSEEALKEALVCDAEKPSRAGLPVGPHTCPPFVST
jgi:Tfp pilus assembly protein PilF